MRLTQEVTELVEDVKTRSSSLLQQEGAAPHILGQRGQARPEVARRLLGLLRSSSGGEDEDRGED